MRTNSLNVPMIPESIRKQLFPNTESVESKFKVAKAKDLLRRFNLENFKIAEGSIPEIPDMVLPPLLGKDLGEHFEKMGLILATPWLQNAKFFSSVKLPAQPKEWLNTPNWVRYEEGKPPEQVPYPQESVFVFDVETAVRYGNNPVMACAVSEEAWYGWVSPELSQGGESLIPLGTEKKLVIAHNASFDRARVKNEYRLADSGLRFFDTMSAHILCSGMSSKQKLAYAAINSRKKKIEDDSFYAGYEPEWATITANNSLKDCVEFYLGKQMSKDDRDYFVTGTIESICDNFQKLMVYNATDVALTFQLFKTLFPRFVEHCPSPVSFVGFLTLGQGYIPTSMQKWEGYRYNCQKTYNEAVKETKDSLLAICDDLLKQFKNGSLDHQNDDWLRHLNWEMPSSRAKKLKDKPEWYRELCKGKTINLTAKTRVTPYLLKMKWENHPLYFAKEYGWGFIVKEGQEFLTNKEPLKIEGVEGKFYRLPHKDGDDCNVGTPLAKDFIKSMEQGVLSSDDPLARRVIELAAQTSYWVSIQKRVNSQYVVYEKDKGVIIPQVIPAGTVTRRAVESLWLTASNPKPTRIGSELKTVVEIPQGYVRVGSDVAS